MAKFTQEIHTKTIDARSIMISKSTGIDNTSSAFSQIFLGV